MSEYQEMHPNMKKDIAVYNIFISFWTCEMFIMFRLRIYEHPTSSPIRAIRLRIVLE